jgi:hypothetical protein
MDADVKAEFDEIKKLLNDIVKQLGAGSSGSASAPVRPVGTLLAAPFGRIKDDLRMLEDDDIVLVPAHRMLGRGERDR